MRLSTVTKKILFLIFIFIEMCIHLPAQSGNKKYWIYFYDKGIGQNILSLKKTNIESFARSIGFSEKALERRKKVLSTEDLITKEDLPIEQSYLKAIEDCGAEVVSRSNWMNAISVRVNRDQQKKIASLPFVKSIEPVRTWKSVDKESREPVFQSVHSFRKTTGQYGLDYGQSLLQLELIRVPQVHDIWIDGTGVFVGMNDNGFRWRAHEALKNMKIIREYDFIDKDSLTENEAIDPPGQDGHGTLTLSTLGGFKEGQLIGPGFNASFELAKTEVNSSETEIEEDYWVAGLEWHERNGVDVVSSSLGYNIFDDGKGYTYANGDFDGKHAVTSRAAARAAQLGVIVVTAMGNEGNTVGSILAPADADSIISAGAVNADKKLAGFSSIGPTNDGRTKPDVCALGVAVYCATRDSTQTYTRASGTSLSTPLTAGVASLVISARPELTPLQVRDALRNSASQAANPDNRLGWGVLDAWEAVLYHGMVISSNPKIVWTGNENRIAAYVISKNSIDASSVLLYYSAEIGGFLPIKMSLVNPYPGMGQGSGLYMASLPRFPVGQLISYYISAKDSKENRTSPYNAPIKFYTLNYGDSSLTGAKNLFPSQFVLNQNYPNPISINNRTRDYITTIGYQLPYDSHIKLELFDLLGRRFAVVKEGDESMGSHTVEFNTSLLSTGMYFYRLSSGGFSDVKRMVVVK